VGVFNYKDIYCEMKQLIRHILREHTREIREGSGGANKLNTEKFIERAKNIYGNKYDYSKVEYKTSGEPVVIICPIHGEFTKTPNKFISNVNPQGCPKCGRQSMKEKITDTKDIFLDKATEKFGNKYDYSKVSYVNSNTKVKIICPIHGEFEQTPSRHIHGATGCPKCGGSEKRSTEKFIELAKIQHGNKYDYSKVDYKNQSTKVVIICPKHGEFTPTPYNFLNGSGCPICQESKGEKLISQILSQNEVLFTPQKKFTDCLSPKSKGKFCYSLPFDFYLPLQNTCIEFDGRQHFEPTDFHGGEESFKYRKKLDKLKNKYCKKNGIKLIRIPYTMKKEEIEPYILKELGI
jgi:hypothetical protein